MRPQFDYGDPVRVIRQIRNDGTYPGVATGALLIRRGSMGYVQQIGRFLQDQIIYGVHFVEQGGRLVGCREQELIPAAAPWIPSQFETRDRVYARLDLAIQGRVVVSAGSLGQIVAVRREPAHGVHYQVRFAEQLLQVPESALTAGADDALTALATSPVVGKLSS